jgi:hypothetical protein
MVGAIAGLPGRRKDSSFSEEKEAKRLYFLAASRELISLHDT